MYNKSKKIISLIAALLVTAGSLTAVAPVSAIDGVEPLVSSECEDLVLANGATVATDVYGKEYPGYTGDGFVWVPNSGTMTFTVNAPETGLYRLETRCIMYLGSENPDEVAMREASVSAEGPDGTVSSKTVKISHTDTWQDFSFGDIKLTKGENKVTFGGGWGFCLYDNMTFTQTPAPDYSKASAVPVDAKATDETKALMQYLKSVYGSHVLSGQQEIYGGGHDGDYEKEFDYIENLTGELPAIRGFDFMNYNPMYGWDDNSTERCIDWVKNKGGIATACWHLNVPIDFDNYEVGDVLDWKECSYKNYQESNSTFNTANVLVEGTKEREFFEAAMEDLAEQFLILQENNVPVIFRPLHEAQGNDGNFGGGTSWFWWGDRGSEVYKELWKLLYTTLTEKYGLHNLIWEFNSYNYSNSPDWYPGDEYVDIVAYDKYNANSGPNLSAISDVFNYLVELTDGGKMVAMAENDTIPSVENMTIENANWLYFCPWYDEHIMSSSKQDMDNLVDIYQSDYCITLDELPEDLYVLSGVNPNVPLYGDADCSGDIEIADAVMVLCFVTDPENSTIDEQGIINADVYQTGDGLSAQDALSIQKYLAQIIKELPEVSEE